MVRLKITNKTENGITYTEVEEIESKNDDLLDACKRQTDNLESLAVNNHKEFYKSISQCEILTSWDEMYSRALEIDKLVNKEKMKLEQAIDIVYGDTACVEDDRYNKMNSNKTDESENQEADEKKMVVATAQINDDHRNAFEKLVQKYLEIARSPHKYFVFYREFDEMRE